LVLVKTQSLSLTVLLCLYVIFAFSINPFMNDFIGMSIEVTDQNNEGVFSSLSRNFEQTVQEINSGDEKSTTSTSTSTDSSSNSGDEKSTTSTSTSTDSSSNSGDEKSSPSNSIGSNSTATGDLEKKNQTDVNQQK
jgi:hypothetical protein